MGGEPAGVSNIMKISKNIFSEFKGDNWAKNACGNVTNQPLSACLAKSGMCHPANAAFPGQVRYQTKPRHIFGPVPD
jgi:hypothetical protein